RGGGGPARGPPRGGVAGLEGEPAAGAQVAAAGREGGGPLGLVGEVLRAVAHQDDEIGTAGGDVGRRAVHPGDEVAARAAAGRLEGGRRGVDADRPDAAVGEVDAEDAGAAAEVDDVARTELVGQRQVEVVVPPAGVLDVVGGDGARVLGPEIEHAPSLAAGGEAGPGFSGQR